MAEVDTLDVKDAAAATQTVATSSKVIKTIGLPADSASSATDTTSVTHTSLLKQISKSIQLMVFGAGTAAAAQRTTLASDDPAVAALGEIATALGITALDLGSGTGGSRTLRFFADTAQWIGGAGVNGTAVRRVTIATDDAVNSILGTTSGAAVITDANGTIQQYLRGLVKQWIAGTLVIGAGTNVIGTVKTRFFSAIGGTLTRPANTTAYAANDAVSNNGTAGSVTAQTATLSDTNDDPISIERVVVDTTDTGLAAGKTIRAYIFNSDPTASSGVGGGDNSAWSQKKAGFIGSLSGAFTAFSDGGKAVLTPDAGSRIICNPVSGAKTVYILYQTLDAWTPSANSTTLIPTFEGYQGRA